MKKTLSLLFALMLVALTGGCRLHEPERYARLQFADGTRPTRVLMIGNSLTYYNDLPGLLQQFSAREKSPIYIEKIAVPYSSLKGHWDRGEAVKRIQQGPGGGAKWDYVVVQEFSRMPVTDPEESTTYYSMFNREITRAGATMIVFENWTRRGKQDEYAAMSQAYRRIVTRTQAQFAPIGAAFRAAASERPEISLLLDDRHPTDAGTYLAAAVLYHVLYHKPAAALPVNLEGPSIPPEWVPALREIADKTVGASR